MRSRESVDVVVIGAGQAGLAISYWLTQQGIEHLVLEQDRIAESWRSQRWDSFCLVTPNWTVQLPGFGYDGPEPDGFMGREDVVDYLDAYAHKFGPPVRTGVRVAAVEQNDGLGYRVMAGDSTLKAHAVVVATGSYRDPKLPAFARSLPSDIVQLHSSQYKNPGSLPEGGVLVVGTGQSGVQIAEELHEAARPVFVSVSGCPRVPRRYRGKDSSWWLKTLGLYERTVDTLKSPDEKRACHPYSSGGRGGHDIYLRQLAREGVTLMGRIQAADGSRLTFARDLEENLRKADEFVESALKQLDEVVATMGMQLPPDNNPRGIGPSIPAEENPIRDLDLREAGIESIIWATGYRPDFSFVKLAVFDERGDPIQRRGITNIPGLYFVGLDWLHKPKSGLLYGVGEDAEHIASTIVATSKSQTAEVRK